MAGSEQKHKTLLGKKNQSKKGKGVVQVVDCLPSNCEALSSNFSTTKKAKTR
jgi:hypothetical protein